MMFKHRVEELVIHFVAGVEQVDGMGETFQIEQIKGLTHWFCFKMLKHVAAQDLRDHALFFCDAFKTITILFVII